MNRSNGSTSCSVLALVRAILFIVCGVALIAAIIDARDLDQAGSTFSEQGRQQTGRLSVEGPTPTPLPCPLCWQQLSFSENFDGVTPPALPPDWLATNAQGPPPVWMSSNFGVPVPPADTLPNAAFVDDPAVISDKRIDSPGFTFFEGGGVRLTFRQNFNLEAPEQNQNVGYDGGVLEVSSDGGNTFQDLLAAGGHFVVGGYNRTIAPDRGSPIAGRQAWSGTSDGFITTVVDVPNFQTPSTKVRWRMASDSSGPGEGWRIDSVNVTWCHGQGTPCGTPTATPTPSPRQTPIPRVRPTPPPRQ